QLERLTPPALQRREHPVVALAVNGLLDIDVGDGGGARILDEARADRPRLDQRDLDAAALKLQPQRVREGFERELGGAVSTAPWRRNKTEHGRAGNDPAFAIGPHGRDQTA